MKLKQLAATLFIIGTTFWLVAASTAPPSYSSALVTSASSCGVERSPVKHLSDPKGPAVAKTAPKDVTVSQLVSIPAPSRKELDAATNTRFPAEMSVYRVKVLVVGYKVESDSDFHIVIADPDKPSVTMIAEIPAGQCGEGAERASFYALQAKFVASFSKPTAKFHTLPKPVPATFTGVFFFDFIHGQTGVAPNGAEIHPLSDFTLP